MRRGWQVHKNLTGGYDLYAAKERVHRNIEVKTRDPYKADGTYAKMTVFISSFEMEICDFIIIYLHKLNKFFILNKSEITSMEHFFSFKYLCFNNEILKEVIFKTLDIIFNGDK